MHINSFAGIRVFPIFYGNNEHSEVFSLVFAQMFVVNFMGSANGANVMIVHVRKQFKTLVNDNFMYHKIGKSIERNAYANKQPHVVKHESRDVTIGTRNGENKEEGIVFFKETRLYLMVVFVKVPKKSMHYIFMGEPSGELHEKEGY
jgi:hypothetical protein